MCSRGSGGPALDTSRLEQPNRLDRHEQLCIIVTLWRPGSPPLADSRQGGKALSSARQRNEQGATMRTDQQSPSSISPTGVTAQWIDDVFAVSCPWNPSFVSESRQLKGGWDQSRRLWLFQQGEAHIRALLNEIFHTDGSPAPGIDILLDLDLFACQEDWIGLIEIGGRRIISAHPDRESCQFDSSASLAHGEIYAKDGFLEWLPGSMIEVQRLPEAITEHLSDTQLNAVRILARRGLNISNLRHQESELQAQLHELRDTIKREEQTVIGLAPDPNNIPPGNPIWRLRCRPNGDGTNKVIIHLDGCMASPSTRMLTTAEVADLANRGATLCRVCGAYNAARSDSKLPQQGPALPN